MNARVHVVTVDAALSVADPETATVVTALGVAGIPISARIVVDDDEMAIERTLAGDGGLTVILAGRGGSAGDAVRRVVARVAGARLALHERLLHALEERHRRLDRPMPRRDERLALVPQGATLWLSDDAEPAWALESAAGAFAVLPRGSERAIGAIVEQHLVPFAVARVAGRGAVVVRTLKTAGVSIAEVEERLASWLGRDGDTTVTVVPTEGDASVTIRARGATAAAAAEALAPVERELRAALGDDCYGADADTLEQVVGQSLRERGLMLAVAESCTGGLLGHRITSPGGSSAYFERGLVVYSNDAKMQLLGVPDEMLRTHGAVSAPTAEAMARGVCANACTPCGLSITGIAGPDGGTPTKPVGTVFIGLAFDGEVTSRRFRFAGDRASVKWQSSQMALDMLRRRLGGA